MSNKEYKNAKARESYQRNKNKRIAYQKWYRENHPLLVKLRKKEYYNQNKGRVKESQKQYYLANKKRLQLLMKNSREVIKKAFLKYKEGKCCSICGYKEYPEILQFHHKEGNKEFNISTFRRLKNKELLEAEIKKCVLLCPNCHMWLHYSQNKKRK